MAEHERQSIRHAVVAQLTGATSAGDRVFPTRMWPWRTATLPALAVYTLQETNGPRTLDPNTPRTISLAVDAAVSLTDAVDDALDALALEVEQAMDADLTVAGLAFDLALTQTEIDILTDQARPFGVARLTYDLTYYPRR